MGTFASSIEDPQKPDEPPLANENSLSGTKTFQSTPQKTQGDIQYTPQNKYIILTQPPVQLQYTPPQVSPNSTL